MALFILILGLNFIIPTQRLIARESLPAEGLSETPWVVEQIRDRESRSEDLFRTYQPYASDESWFLVVSRHEMDRETAYDFGGEYGQTHLMPLLWGVDTIRGFDNLVTRRYERVLLYLERYPFGKIIGTGPDQGNDGLHLNLPEGTLSLLGMMNVKYIWSIVPFDEQHTQNEIFLVAAKQVSSLQVPIHLYINNLFLPRIYTPTTITMLPESEDTFPVIIETPHDFAKIGFIECECEKKESTPQGTVTISAQVHRNDVVAFHAEASADSWVVVSNSYIPSWVATIDGNEAPIHYANYIFQGIFIPTGEHDVRIVYKAPYSFLF